MTALSSGVETWKFGEPFHLRDAPGWCPFIGVGRTGDCIDEKDSLWQYVV